MSIFYIPKEEIDSIRPLLSSYYQNIYPIKKAGKKQ